jgi:PIN domain nuclease of toxin-antitoxin system
MTTGYLLDSHVLIWSLYQQDKLSTKYKRILESSVETWISIATIWEIEIKKHTGKLPLPDTIWEQAEAVGHQFLAIAPRQAVLAAGLPPHHGDPFDRMLIAQAISEGLSIMTVDRQFSSYDVTVA